MFLSKATYNKYICQTKETKQSIAIGTVRMLFVEPEQDALTSSLLLDELYVESLHASHCAGVCQTVMPAGGDSLLFLLPFQSPCSSQKSTRAFLRLLRCPSPRSLTHGW